MRYPKAIRSGTVRGEFALNIDLAPTLLELAGVTVPGTMQGRSLVPLLQGKRPVWRKSFLIEYYSDKVFPRILQMGYKAVRNGRWKYIHYLELEGMDELYDLRSDPYEIKNLIHDPGAAKVRDKMKQEMERLLKETSATANRGIAERIIGTSRLVSIVEHMPNSLRPDANSHWPVSELGDKLHHPRSFLCRVRENSRFAERISASTRRRLEPVPSMRRTRSRSQVLWLIAVANSSAFASTPQNEAAICDGNTAGQRC